MVMHAQFARMLEAVDELRKRGVPDGKGLLQRCEASGAPTVTGACPPHASVQRAGHGSPAAHARATKHASWPAAATHTEGYAALRHAEGTVKALKYKWQEVSGSAHFKQLEGTVRRDRPIRAGDAAAAATLPS